MDENRFNVRIKFTGLSTFDFQLPEIGKVSMVQGKDIFVRGLTQGGVELLRRLRPLHVEHQLNAKQDGCYRVIDVYKLKNMPVAERKDFAPSRQRVIASAQQLKKELVQSNGPLSMDEILGTNQEPQAVVPEVQEPEVKNENTEPGIKLSDYKVRSGANINKKLKDLSKKDLNKTIKYAPNPEDKEKAKMYLDEINKGE